MQPLYAYLASSLLPTLPSYLISASPERVSTTNTFAHDDFCSAPNTSRRIAVMRLEDSPTRLLRRVRDDDFDS